MTQSGQEFDPIGLVTQYTVLHASLNSKTKSRGGDCIWGGELHDRKCQLSLPVQNDN